MKESSRAPVVGVIMGSQSDWRVMKFAVEVLKKLDIPFEKKIVSAHRTPDRMREYARSARERGIGVIIAGAGGSAHLPGMVAAYAPVTPVLGVPVNDKDGIDAKDRAARGSMDEMPPGVPMAVFALGKPGAENAAQFAAQILAVADAEIYKRLLAFRQQQTDSVPDEPKDE